MSLELTSPDAGLAFDLDVLLVIETPGQQPLQVVGRRGLLDDGDDARLVLEVTTTDFPGRGPVFSARTVRNVHAFGDDGTATVERPLRRRFSVALPPADGILSRRVEARASLLPVDLVHDGARSGGLPLPIPASTIATFARPERPPLEDALTGGDGDMIFLAAATSPTDRHDEVLGRLVAALDRTGGEAHEAVLAALTYMSGEGHGRDVSRWRSWWTARATSD